MITFLFPESRLSATEKFIKAAEGDGMGGLGRRARRAVDRRIVEPLHLKGSKDMVEQGRKASEVLPLVVSLPSVMYAVI
jgi:hypothetical protein